MQVITIAFGGMLFVLGIAGYVLTGSEHPTALIPAAFGAVFEILGLLAMRPDFRKHAMHAAAAVALLGFFGTVPGVIKGLRWALGTAPVRPAAVTSQIIMAGLCLLFVGLCVNSFVQVRRARERQAGFPVGPIS